MTIVCDHICKVIVVLKKCCSLALGKNVCTIGFSVAFFFHPTPASKSSPLLPDVAQHYRETQY